MLFNRFSKTMLTVYGFILFSCSPSKDHSTIFKALNEGLNTSSKTIKRESEFIYSALEEKRMDPLTAYRADVWEPKALLLKSRSSQVISYIRNITTSLKNDDDVKLVLQEKDEGKKLYDTLNSYKKDILKIDPLIQEEFRNKLSLLPLAIDSTLSKDEFDNKYFRNTSVAEARALLGKLENNVVIAEKDIAAFCLEQIPSHGDDYTMYSAIVAQSSSRPKAGEELEIIAGVGAFTRRGSPVILINDKNIPISEDGTAHFKFKASNEPGEHRMRLRIEFTDQDGKKQWILKEVVYTVSK